MQLRIYESDISMFELFLLVSFELMGFFLLRNETYRAFNGAGCKNVKVPPEIQELQLSLYYLGGRSRSCCSDKVRVRTFQCVI